MSFIAGENKLEEKITTKFSVLSSVFWHVLFPNKNSPSGTYLVLSYAKSTE